MSTMARKDKAAATGGEKRGRKRKAAPTTAAPVEPAPAAEPAIATQPAPKRRPGRPSKYDPAFCDLVIELGEQGKSLAQMASRIGVLRETMMEWAKVHPEFSDSIKIAMQLAQSWWEEQGQIGLGMGKDFNATAFIFQMKNRFRADYTEKVEVKHDGSIAFSNLWQLVGQGKAEGIVA